MFLYCFRNSFLVIIAVYSVKRAIRDGFSQAVRRFVGPTLADLTGDAVVHNVTFYLGIFVGGYSLILCTILLKFWYPALCDNYYERIDIGWVPVLIAANMICGSHGVIRAMIPWTQTWHMFAVAVVFLWPPFCLLLRASNFYLVLAPLWLLAIGLMFCVLYTLREMWGTVALRRNRLRICKIVASLSGVISMFGLTSTLNGNEAGYSWLICKLVLWLALFGSFGGGIGYICRLSTRMGR